MTNTFQIALPEASLAPNGIVGVTINGWAVAIFRGETGICAVLDRCTHAGAVLSRGRVRGISIVCPLHGARFDLRSGACIAGAHPSLRTFDVRIVDGCIEVAVPNGTPTVAERPVT